MSGATESGRQGLSPECTAVPYGKLLVVFIDQTLAIVDTEMKLALWAQTLPSTVRTVTVETVEGEKEEGETEGARQSFAVCECYEEEADKEIVRVPLPASAPRTALAAIAHRSVTRRVFSTGEVHAPKKGLSKVKDVAASIEAVLAHPNTVSAMLPALCTAVQDLKRVALTTKAAFYAALAVVAEELNVPPPPLAAAECEDLVTHALSDTDAKHTQAYTVSLSLLAPVLPTSCIVSILEGESGSDSIEGEAERAHALTLSADLFMAVVGSRTAPDVLGKQIGSKLSPAAALQTLRTCTLILTGYHTMSPLVSGDTPSAPVEMGAFTRLFSASFVERVQARAALRLRSPPSPTQLTSLLCGIVHPGVMPLIRADAEWLEGMKTLRTVVQALVECGSASGALVGAIEEILYSRMGEPEPLYYVEHVSL
ncbi:hypothetical protein KIPB_002839 [Kipferlia bialata]|uniref:Uncharacterized protein n=1 Tax=Kipferlia bialata TaxID=797122 RepID=A0A9K3CSV8_9EUKA|nr:hypothetical protein KIPB_002839 [Kipferlia bialata]|eukprot:g2839.t1